jgi:prepilin-type processing-associated H-X9-DG protein
MQMQPFFKYKEETAPLHGGGYNVLFADGHVALFKRKDYLNPPRAASHWNRDNKPHPELFQNGGRPIRVRCRQRRTHPTHFPNRIGVQILLPNVRSTLDRNQRMQF